MYSNSASITGITNSLNEMYQKTVNQAKKLQKNLPNYIPSLYDSKLTNEVKEFKEFEPKTSNRWIVEFPKSANILIYYAKSFERPTFPFRVGDIFSVTLLDPILETSLTEELLNFIEKNNTVGFDVKLKLLDPLGNVVEKWIFKQCKIEDISWSKLEYKNCVPLEIELNISFSSVKIKM